MNITRLTITSNNQIINNPTQKRLLNRETGAAQNSIIHTQKPIIYQNQYITDTFSFTSQTNYVEKLITHIDKLLKNPHQLTEKEDYAIRGIIQSALDTIKQKENIIGAGFHETVYRLNDKYVAKLPPSKNAYQLKIFCPKGEILIPQNQYSDLTTYKGNILLQVGDFKILENLGSHTPAGLPRSVKPTDCHKYYVHEYLPKFAQVSQENYNALLEDCGRLNDRYYTIGSYHLFDSVNPNNIVLKDGKLYWVDVINTSQNNWNSMTDILDMLLNTYSVGRTVHYGYGESLIHAKTIFKKIIVAGMNADIPVCGTSYFTNEIWRELVKNLKIKVPAKDVVNNLQEIYKTDNRELRVEKTVEYIDSLFKQN